MDEFKMIVKVANEILNDAGVAASNSLNFFNS